MLLFRPAVPSDVDAVVALVTAAYRGESSRAGWTTEADLLDGPRVDAGMLRADMADPDGTVLVGVDDAVSGSGTDGVPGLVACCALARRGGGTGYFGMFAVDPTRQGDGIGSRVLAEAERVARDEWALSALTMTVLEQRPELLAFYGRRGYAPTGEHVPFPYGEPRVGTPLRDDLRMAVLRKTL